jgi:hypothetical protein
MSYDVKSGLGIGAVYIGTYSIFEEACKVRDDCNDSGSYSVKLEVYVNGI